MKVYEACFILNVAGKEAGIKDVIDSIDKQIHAGGGKTLKTQRMDKRDFARVTGATQSGYYVNFVFEMDQDKINAFREKFKLNDDVYRLIITEASPGAADREPIVETSEE